VVLVQDMLVLVQDMLDLAQDPLVLYQAITIDIIFIIFISLDRRSKAVLEARKSHINTTTRRKQGFLSIHLYIN
jgi:hypothetical protein